MYRSRGRRLGKAGLFTVIGGFIGAVVAEGCEFVAIGLLSAGTLSAGAAAAPVLITIGAVGGLGAYGLHSALKK
jgi:hypothetical protein